MFEEQLSQRDVAAILTARGDRISRTRVFQIEQRALAKIASDPIIRALARDLGLYVPVFDPPRGKGRKPCPTLPK